MCLQFFFLKAAQTSWLEAAIFVSQFTLPLRSWKSCKERGKEIEKPAVAMYSSLFGGITLDPSLMCIPIDDDMVHGGHGVFGTTVLIDGYWLSSGPGDFRHSPKDCSEPAFYAVVIRDSFSITSKAPMKSALFASLKSELYTMEAAQKKGASSCVWVD